MTHDRIHLAAPVIMVGVDGSSSSGDAFSSAAGPARRTESSDHRLTSRNDAPVVAVVP
jgi:hypothetical protein